MKIVVTSCLVRGNSKLKINVFHSDKDRFVKVAISQTREKKTNLEKEET